MTTPKTPDLAAVVARVRESAAQLRSHGYVFGSVDFEDLEALCAAAERVAELEAANSLLHAQAERLAKAVSELQHTMQMMDLGAEALAAERDAQADLAALRAERDGLAREVSRRKAMQPMDRDGRPITQAPANRLLIAYYDDLPAARAEIAALHERLAAAEAALKAMTKRALATRTPGGKHEADR